METIGQTIQNACRTTGITQRELAEKTGISQPTLNRIIKGTRTIKMPEIILIAEATGCTVAQLTGNGVANRVQCVARSTNGSSMDAMKQQLLHFMELDAYLEDQAIPEA